MPTRNREQSILGRRLVVLRQKAYLSQLQLAQRSGLSQGTIQGLEQGVRNDPCLSTLIKLARALKQTPAELVDGLECSDNAIGIDLS